MGTKYATQKQTPKADDRTISSIFTEESPKKKTEGQWEKDQILENMEHFLEWINSDETEDKS